jgi:DNA replication protein DnaC
MGKMHVFNLIPNPLLIKALAKTHLIVIDDGGFKIFAEEQRHDFFKILENRHSLKSTLITSQLPVDYWQESSMVSPWPMLSWIDWCGKSQILKKINRIR